ARLPQRRGNAGSDCRGARTARQSGAGDRPHAAGAGGLMLKANLATRPFYNERAIHVLVAVAAAIVLVVTVLNVSRLVTLSRHSTELSSHTSADRAEASRLSAEAVRIRRTINKDELALVMSAAEEANALIDQRTFSWTEFFNQIEATIPPDVM